MHHEHHRHEKFNPTNLARLNNPERLDETNPRTIWEALGFPRPNVVVDLGAGTGLFSQAFAELAPEAAVYAVDTEPAMLEWMSQHRVPEVGPRLLPLRSSETDVPLSDGIADVVVTMNLHHELPDPVALYREAARLLAAGGSIAVVDWKPGAEGNGPPQEIRVTAEEIARALEEAGFSQTAIHPGFERHSLVTGVR